MTNQSVFLHNHKTSQNFEWVKGKYSIKTIDGFQYIVPVKVQGTKKKLNTYRPDFAHICEVLMSWDFNEESNILSFVNEYGLLGIENWLGGNDTLTAYNTLAVYHKDIDWLKRYNGSREPDYKGGWLNFDTETNHKWQYAFGILSKGTQKSTAIYKDNGVNKIAGEIEHVKLEHHPYTVGRGIISNNKSDIGFWKAYRESLELFRYTVICFQRAMELFTSNSDMQPFAYRPAFVPLGKGKTGIAIESLIEGVYACAISKMIQGIELRPCIAINESDKYPEEKCRECRCEYRYFWLDGTGNSLKKKFGVTECKPHNNAKQTDKRSGVAQQIPQRGKRKID